MSSKLLDLIEQEINNAIEEYVTSRSGGLTLHPFDNHLLHKQNRTEYQNLFEELSDAIIMDMISAYSMDQVREVTRKYAEMASQGPGGIGGRFTEQELEEIMILVFDKLKEAFNVDLRSEMPEDRLHPKYMSEQ
jgi:alpha-amylase/alpha-mannosidase (GH57 family)